MASRWPAFFPAQTEGITSRSALAMAQRYRRSGVYVPSLQRTVPTAYVPPRKTSVGQPPVCFLHGFDSSSFDFRKLLPYVEGQCETWAVDLVGWGFSDHSLFLEEPSLPNGPDVKRDHLYQFWKTSIQRPMCLVGVSLGGAVAIDFALRYPEAVAGLVLSAAQGYTDGLGLLSRLPSPIAKLGVQVLQTAALRRTANQLAYHTDVDVEQAMRIGRLHTFLPGSTQLPPSFCVGHGLLGWTEASLAFIKSDGYALSGDIASVDVPSLILWGREDRVLGTDSAQRFETDIQDSRLEWIDACGHAGHLEKYTALGDHLLEFLEELRVRKRVLVKP